MQKYSVTEELDANRVSIDLEEQTVLFKKRDEMRVLITGAAGHLGPDLSRAFLRNGTKVRLLLHQRKIKGLSEEVETMWGDITQPDSIKRVVEGVDVIVHLAAMVEPKTENNPELAKKINVDGTKTIVDIIKDMGMSIPLVYISSVSVFGLTPDATECLHPDRNMCNPATVYARTKLQAENLIRESGIDYVILRLTAVPYKNFSLNALKCQMFIVPLENRVEFCHPDDANLAIVNSVKYFDRVKGKTLVISGGPGQRMRYKEMMATSFGAFGLPVPPRHKFAEGVFALDWYDTSESQALLNYQNKTLDDYNRDLVTKLPAPLIIAMRRVIGPLFGRALVRLI